MTNAYYDPEQYELTTVGTIDWDNEPYEFNETLVLRDKDGVFYWADDQGCSCPVPFEDHSFPSDYESGDFFALSRYLTERQVEKNNSDVDAQVVELLARARW